MHSFMKVSEHAYTVQYSVLLAIAYVHLTYIVTACLYWLSCETYVRILNQCPTRYTYNFIVCIHGVAHSTNGCVWQ